jgi:hypothetical protein
MSEAWSETLKKKTVMKWKIILSRTEHNIRLDSQKSNIQQDIMEISMSCKNRLRESVKLNRKTWKSKTDYE